MTKIGRYVEYEESMAYLKGYEGADVGNYIETQMGFDGFDPEDCEDEREFTFQEIREAEQRGVHVIKLWSM